ncbi:hypothetical protein MUO14_09540 [Halobacillus shinanisalinarum]|uniref:Proteinase inhibitor I42 chagasin domain-containing protein n=1 Tax=Halobacillus shinanisalinarum TaxID=2932258 RepID=A0ABY4H448_9BACI|nr:hypothetical protein [Halobacillus shinanisalinarum]UOQ95139.1 hypothetical protein MUO14_09540 [Halobacillus shinanisalinarum]
MVLKKTLGTVLLSLSLVLIGGFDNAVEASSSSTEKVVKAKVDLETIKYELEVDQTKKEVIEVLGEDKSVVINMMDGSLTWRYDINTVKEYSFENEYDIVDIEGIQSGDIGLQVFIGWNQESNTINRITAYYLNNKDKRVYEYRVYPDESIKVIPIT